MKKGIIYTIIVLIGISFLGTCIYFVAGVSATFPPIKIYECSGDSTKLSNAIHHFVASHPEVNIKDTLNRGSTETGYSKRISFEIKTDTSKVEISLDFERISKEDRSSLCKINVYEIFDLIHKTGGYAMKATGMKKLVNEFENGFLTQLQSSEHIRIKPLPVPRGWFLDYWN